MEISLAINTRNPVDEWMMQLIDSAVKAFDEIVIYIDENGDRNHNYSRHVKIINDGQHRRIKDGFNLAVSHTTGEWVCPFCDDDYFIKIALKMLIKRIKDGQYDDADIIHFPVNTPSGTWGTSGDFGIDEILSNNLIPHGCFIRRKVFDCLGGYKIDAAADWNLWIRAKRAGYRFKGFERPVYYFRMGQERSAWESQNKELGFARIAQEARAIA